MKTILLIMMLALSGCTVGEAVLGAGAAGLGGYIIGRENQPRQEYRHRRYCEERRGYTRCWD
jgi:hypothetical protein